MVRPVICPTITAYSNTEYAAQIKAVQGFATRIHIDMMDGDFAPTLSPELAAVWWPHHLQADIHLMYRRPMELIEDIQRMHPRMVIVHAEAEVHHMHFAAELHKAGIRAGLAILQDTPIRNIQQIMHSFDHILIFSGHLGYHGGHAELGNLGKIIEVKELHPHASIGWDGGIDEHNVRHLVESGVSSLNVGSFIQKAEDPEKAFYRLQDALK